MSLVVPLLLYTFLILPTLLVEGSTTVYHVAINTTLPLGTVHARYVAYTVDWWPPDQGCEPNGWGPHANVLEVDLSSPKLRLLVKALGPSILRIGGSLDKVVQYDVPGITACDDPHVPCLNATRWDQWHQFAHSTNSQIVFGLSYPQTTNYGQWNATQATALLTYSHARNYSRQTTLYGVELGEELTEFRLGTKAFDSYVQAYHECAKLLRSIYYDYYSNENHSSSNERPYLMGPCPGMNVFHHPGWFSTFLNHTQGALDVAVYHSYNQIEENKLYLNFTPPDRHRLSSSLANAGTTPGDTGWQAVAMKQTMVEAMEHPIPLWLGEMGPHNGGGGPGNISSTFASSFGYLDTLGSLARLTHRVLARQTLVGGKYELLRCTTTSPECELEPHPDYWVALLWKRLMGTTVLEAPKVILPDPHDTAWTEAVRLHAHCRADGTVTVAFSNLSPNHTFLVETSSDLGATRVEYSLQGHEDGIHSSQLELNGSVLHVGDTLMLPPLEGRRVSNVNNPWSLPPVTLGFMVFPDANAAACMVDNIDLRINR